MQGIQSWLEFVSNHWSGSDGILERILQHTQITVLVIVLGTVFSVALGIFIQRRPTLRAGVLSVTGIFLTIPSLALFAIFIPVVGTGNTAAEIALFMYALLPIVRNTVTGLDEVSPAVVESAQGMGMGQFRQLTQVRLPLAWPVIMAGIRVSTLMVVGIAAIAVLVGGNGLGSFIQSGLTRMGFPNSMESVWTGTIFTILLGLFLDLVLSIIQRFSTSRGLRA